LLFDRQSTLAYRLWSPVIKCGTISTLEFCSRHDEVEKTMKQAAIFVPFVGIMLLTLVVWIYMYVRRIPFLMRSGLINQRQLTPGELARQSPPAVANPSDNFKNLFELPVLFYAVVLYLYVTQQVDALYLAAAWVFFGFRVLHSVVHSTFNPIPLRFALYMLGSIALWLMVLRIALTVLH
jgi:hypothetical protein